MPEYPAGSLDRKPETGFTSGPYFHVVFTVPDTLNRLFMHYPADLYSLLFATAWETIAQFSFTQLHAETGMVAVLHTWGQNLSLHPHVHCVVPGGGVNYQGQWKQVHTSATGQVFLFLSGTFRRCSGASSCLL